MATMTWWNSRCWRSPSCSMARRSGRLNRAVPGTTRTPARLRSWAMPPVRSSTTRDKWLRTAAMSTSIEEVMPQPATRLGSATVSATSMRALGGMHPTFRQVPPSSPRSTRVTSRPRRAALRAAAYPPGPAPTTRRSALEATSPTTIPRFSSRREGSMVRPGRPSATA